MDMQFTEANLAFRDDVRDCLATIFGGSSEMQRNILAKLSLGL